MANLDKIKALMAFNLIKNMRTGMMMALMVTNNNKLVLNLFFFLWLRAKSGDRLV